VVQAQKVLGGIFVPSNVLDYLVELVYKTDKETLQAKWYESGHWTGKYLKEKFALPVETLRTFLVFSRWDLNEVEVKEVGSSIKIRCISTVLSSGSTELLCKFIEGILAGMGYQIGKMECLKGMIIIETKN
jgi:predicted hydrocarbon binding protein